MAQLKQNAILLEKLDGRLVITLNRPKVRNALSFELQNELQHALIDADNDAEVHCVIIKGAGKDFCAGYDLQDRTMMKSDEYKNLRERHGLSNTRVGSEEWNKKLRGFSNFEDDLYNLERTQRFVMQIFDMHKPVIACVHGQCLAGGVGLATLCDIIVCTEDCKFGFPPARDFGVLPVNMMLYHLGPQWTKRILLTGDSILGSDAQKLGLALKALPTRAEAEQECHAIADRMALIPTGLLAANKRSVNLGLELIGARTAQRLNATLDARGHQSGTWFTGMNEAAAKAGGLANLIKNRNKQFGGGIAHSDSADDRLREFIKKSNL
eukprot:g9296.t1